MLKEEILKNVVLDFFEKEIKNINFLDTRYNLIYFGSYSEKIGNLFIKNNINFESFSDLGFSKNILDKDPFKKNYVKSSKLKPSRNFLKDILPNDFQKEILIDTISLIDWENNIFDFSKINKILRIFRDFRDLGINSQLVNDEIIDIVKKYSDKTNIHANIITSFIYQEFFFDEEFLNKKFKDIYFKSFGVSPLDDETFLKAIEHNNKNKITFNFNQLNDDLKNNISQNNNKKFKV